MSATRAIADPAMLRWVERLEAELAGIGTPLELFVVIDRTRGQMDWMRQHEPDAAGRVDAAIREAYARLSEGANC